MKQRRLVHRQGGERVRDRRAGLVQAALLVEEPSEVGLAASDHQHPLGRVEHRVLAGARAGLPGPDQDPVVVEGPQHRPEHLGRVRGPRIDLLVLEAAGAVAAENAALSVLANAANLPSTAGGCFVSGGSAGNLSALAVARRQPLTPTGRPWRVAVSEDAHSSVRKALWMLGMDALVVPTPDHRLTAAALQEALEADRDPSDIVAVVATAGTTNAGIIDDLAGIAGVAADRGLWFHVDGAYGGAGLLSRQLRPQYAGIEAADSLVVDPHKWLFAPFDCAAVLYRDPSKAREIHTQHAGYLDVLHDSDPEDWNPSDYAYHLTRRARGLPLWFSLAVHGLDAYEAAIDAAITTARRAAELITEADDLELLLPPELSVVLFRRRGWGPSDYRRWSDQLLASQVAFVTPTSWDGETVARLAFVHPDTSLDVVREVIESMR